MSRRVKNLRVICVVSLVFVLGLCGQAKAFPRGVDWRQVQTEHFTIVFLEQHRNFVAPVADMAEAIHEEMSSFLTYTKKDRVYIILTDHIDSFDRMSVPVARDTSRSRVVLLLNDPLFLIPTFGLPAQEWLSLQFIYQYTSMMRHRMDRATRTVFSALFQDLGHSGWMDGGMSLYMAMKQEGQIRNSPYFDMMMRTELLKDDFRFLKGQSAAGSRRWPGDAGLFLYGYSFLSYLSDRYGAELLADLNQAQNRTIPMPSSTGKNFEKIYGRSLNDLQQDWYAWLKIYYDQQTQTIRERPLTPTRPLSDSGYLTGHAEFSPDGQFVYYIEDGPNRDNALIQLRLKDNQKVRLTEGNFSGNISVSADGTRIYFSKTEYFKLYYRLSDLYVLDIAERKVTRLTHGERAFDPTVAPDGNSLVYVATQADKTVLKSLDLGSGEKRVLLERSDAVVKISHPRFSSDGRTLVFQMVTQDEQGERIYLIGADGTQLRVLLNDDARDSSPSWGPDDAYMLFASDRSGVPNIFAYVFEQQRLYQITNVVSGAFKPSVSAVNNAIVLQYYSIKGFDVHLMDLDPRNWTALNYKSSETPVAHKDYPAAAVSEEKGYRSFLPLFSSWPLILPSLGTDDQGFQLGVYLTGSDVLKQNEYSLLALYGFNSGRLELDGEYRYNRFKTKIGLFGYNRTEKYADFYLAGDDDDRAYWEQRQGGGITLGWPLYKSRKSDLVATAEYEYRKISSRTDNEAGPEPDSGVLTDLAARLAFQHSNIYRSSISPESGVFSSLEYKHYDEALGGDYNINSLTGDVRLFIDSFWEHHVIALRGAGGYADGDRLEQGIFQLGGFLFDYESDVWARSKFFFRGYGDRTFRGDRFLLGSAEYRMPFWQVEHPSAIMGGLLYWNSISGTLFFDSGDAWDDETRELEFQYSVGAELGLKAGYWYGKVPVSCDIGVAHGFDEDLGETQIYFQVRVNTFSY